MKEPVKVVMLPTEDKSQIWINNLISENDLHFEEYGRHTNTSQHLYATVSQDVEPIKAGDWCIAMDTNIIFQVSNKDLKGINNFKDLYRKIIATTDPKLTINIWEKDYPTEPLKINLPQVPQSFIEEFVANPDREFEVEYETKTLMKPADVYIEEVKTKLKLNQDNEVNITSVSKCDCTYVQACRICGEKKDLDGDFWKNLPPVKEKMYSLDFILWYSGMKKERIENAHKRWIKENL
jgi:hypothetical protein